MDVHNRKGPRQNGPRLPRTDQRPSPSLAGEALPPPSDIGPGSRAEWDFNPPVCLEDEYELKERADVLTRKLTVISDSAKAFADIIDTERVARLELIIIILIAVEIVIGGLQLWIH